MLEYKEFNFAEKNILFFPDSFSLVELEEKDAKEKIIDLFDKYILPSKFSKIPKQDMIELDFCITRKCNLKCLYCYANQVANGELDLSYDTAKGAINYFLEKYGGLRWKVDFIGQGEPLLNIDLIIEIVTYIKSQKKGTELSFFVITNGTLLSNENYKRLVDNEISIGVSVDGSEKYHNLNRVFANGEGSFSALKQNLKQINIRSSKNIWGLSVATGENDIIDMLEFNHSLGFKRLQIKIARSAGKGNVDRKRIYIHLVEQYKKFFDILKESLLRDEWKLFFSITNNTDAVGKVLKAFLIRQKNFRRCKAGFGRFSILPNGDIYPCSSFGSIEEYKLGNVLKKNIDEGLCKEFATINVDTTSKCKTCWCRYMCGGMCRYSSFIEFSTLDDGNWYDCKLMKMLCEEIVKLVYDIKKKDEMILKKMIRFAMLNG